MTMWTDGNGFLYVGDCRQGDREATDAEVEAWQATINGQRMLTFAEFMALFTADEQAAIVNSTDTQVRILVLRATGSNAIQLGNPGTQQGIRYLVSLGILSDARASEVLAGRAPA